MALLSPGRCVASVDKVSVDSLVSAGVRCVLVDRDNTCVPRDSQRVPPAVCAWVDTLRAAGLLVCVVSNNFHGRQVERSAAELGCPVVHHAMKPMPFGLRRALRMLGVTPSEAVMIGDQIFTDVLAGNLAGTATILVRPQSRRDLWYTHILHLLERPLLRDAHFEGE